MTVLDPVLETERLRLRRLAEDDAAFILELLNDPDFLRFVGDKGVRTLDDAREYLRTGPIASYEQHGYGLYLVARRADGAPLGICGLVRRPTLPHPDVGFAFLPPYRAQGYAAESAAAVLDHARSAHGLERILAIVNPDNHASIRLLGKLGLRFERTARLAEDAPEVQLFALG